MAGKQGRAAWGSIRKQATGRYSASYQGPDGRRHFATSTFSTKRDAGAWLAKERAAIASETWVPPRARRARADGMTVAEAYKAWLDDRDRPLAATTRALYAKHWRTHLEAQLGPRRVAELDGEDVRRWYRGLDTGPTAKAHALGMLRAMLNYVVGKGIRTDNPAAGVGPTKNRRVKDIEAATPQELAAIAAAMRTEPMRVLVIVTAWLALRWGEVTELRRGDVDIERGVVHVRRAVSRVSGTWVVSTPKAGSVRTVAIPPHVVPVLAAHLATAVPDDPDALLFPSRRDGAKHLSPDAFRTEFAPACAAAGRPDLTPHGLRHSGAVIAAQSGATLIDVMRRLGHTSTEAALRYQHSAEARQAAIAEAMSKFAQS